LLRGRGPFARRRAAPDSPGASDGSAVLGDRGDSHERGDGGHREGHAPQPPRPDDHRSPRPAIGVAHYLQGRFEEAIAWARRALAQRADYVVALFLLPYALGQLGRTDEATRALSEVVARRVTSRPEATGARSIAAPGTSWTSCGVATRSLARDAAVSGRLDRPRGGSLLAGAGATWQASESGGMKPVGEPGAGKPHAGFDERDVETEQGAAIETPATERVGQRLGPPTPPRHVSTLPVRQHVALTGGT
jgi:hypothetical protein